MSEFMFGVSKTKISDKVSQRMDEIAKEHGCTLVEATLAGTGYQRWFAGPNLGYPFDRDIARTVLDQCRAENLLPEDE